MLPMGAQHHHTIRFIPSNYLQQHEFPTKGANEKNISSALSLHSGEVNG